VHIPKPSSSTRQAEDYFQERKDPEINNTSTIAAQEGKV
jgi:hypothetical protein